MSINKDVDVELQQTVNTEFTKLQKMKAKVKDVDMKIIKEKAYADASVQYPILLSEMCKNRPTIVLLYKTTIRELEAWKNNPEIKIVYNGLEEDFFVYSQAYVKRKRDASRFDE